MSVNLNYEAMLTCDSREKLQEALDFLKGFEGQDTDLDGAEYSKVWLTKESGFRITINHYVNTATIHIEQLHEIFEDVGEMGVDVTFWEEQDDMEETTFWGPNAVRDASKSAYQQIENLITNLTAADIASVLDLLATQLTMRLSEQN